MERKKNLRGFAHAKRGVALLIALLMLTMMIPLPLSVSAAETGKEEVVLSDGLYYFLSDNNEATICGYSQSTNEPITINIPSEIDGHPVKYISDSAFNPNGNSYIGYSETLQKSTITSVTIPDSVVGIGNNAFSRCEALKSITIPESVTEIGYTAFAYCKSLQNIVIPNSVTKLGFSAFAYCESLTSATIGNSVPSLDTTFVQCSSLTDVTIGNGVKTMNATFSGCSSLKELVIPDGVTTLEHYGGGEGAPYGIFDFCESLVRVTIPDSVTNISDSAFRVYPNQEPFTVVCSKDSTAYQYAIEHEYPYELRDASKPEDITFTTDDGITITADSGVFPSGTTFTSEKVTSGAKYEVAEKADNIQKFVAYDIEALNNNTAVQPNGTVNVTFDVPGNFDLSKTVVYYIADDGKLELVKSSVDTEAHTITATLTHFSTYIVAEVSDSTQTGDSTEETNDNFQTGESDTETNSNPKTGESGTPVLWATLGLFSSASLIWIVAKRRKALKG